MTSDPLRVALHAGILVRHDAISSSLALKIELLDGLAAAGVPVDTRIFVHATDSRDPRVRTAPDVGRMLTDPELDRAEVHVFEFGVWYPGFDVVHLLDPAAVTIGVYHNVTPPELVAPEARPLIECSLAQRENLWMLDHVACDSEFNRDELITAGMDPERLSVLHLPANHAIAEISPWWRRHLLRRQTVTLLFVGRFVRSKGVGDLVHAAARATERGGPPVELVLVGNPLLSDPSELEAVRRAAADGPLRGRVRIERAPPDHVLARLYAIADVLVVPSYHEGYCVPVVEAFASDCQVVAYDAANLPNVVGDCGILVPTGDTDALADGIEAAVRAAAAIRAGAESARVPVHGSPTPAEWRARVRAHLASATREAYARGFAEILAREVARIPGRGRVAEEIRHAAVAETDA